MPVFLWWARLSQWVPQLDVIAQCLAPIERAQAQRLIRLEHRERYMLSHAILRWILSDVLSQAPETLVFEKGMHGKPYLSGRPIEFNMTHSHDMVMYAISLSEEVGVDIEYVEKQHNYDGLMARFFSESEQAAYQKLPEHDRRDAFYRAWTRKEAYLKATGVGLSCPLEQFDVSLDPKGMHCLLRPAEGQDISEAWTLFSRRIEDDYLYSIAIRAVIEVPAPQVWKFSQKY